MKHNFTLIACIALILAVAVYILSGYVLMQNMLPAHMPIAVTAVFTMVVLLVTAVNFATKAIKRKKSILNRSILILSCLPLIFIILMVIISAIRTFLL
ncbi:MAG: hypothetical protein LBV47_01140 [Bacteroidales bacterium]|nr:hypothetical protein [Bacteroidales bacterium]